LPGKRCELADFAALSIEDKWHHAACLALVAALSVRQPSAENHDHGM
jgi:hypothetical protein